MSETNDQRNAAVFQALAAFAAAQTVQNRDALLAAWTTRQAPRFYAVNGNLFLVRGGAEKMAGNMASQSIAEAIADRLNVDLGLGWVPVLP